MLAKKLRLIGRVLLCASVGACATNPTSYWYKPTDLNADWLVDHLWACERGQQATAFIGPGVDFDKETLLQSQINQQVLDSGMSFGQGLATVLIAGAQREVARQNRSMEKGYLEAMGERGWQLISYKEAVTLGLVKPNDAGGEPILLTKAPLVDGGLGGHCQEWLHRIRQIKGRR